MLPLLIYSHNESSFIIITLVRIKLKSLENVTVFCNLVEKLRKIVTSSEYKDRILLCKVLQLKKLQLFRMSKADLWIKELIAIFIF